MALKAKEPMGFVVTYKKPFKSLALEFHRA